MHAITMINNANYSTARTKKLKTLHVLLWQVITHPFTRTCLNTDFFYNNAIEIELICK